MDNSYSGNNFNPSGKDYNIKEKENNTKKNNSNTPISDSSCTLTNELSNPLYNIPVFLSYATPYNENQIIFLNKVIEEIRSILLFPRTLGVTEQETESPITSIRRMILTSYGMLAVAFHRVHIDSAVSRPNTSSEQIHVDIWLSNPYIQIEPAMAYQQGLPLMIIVEDGVLLDGVFGGILEQGAIPLFIPRFSVENEAAINDFFSSVAWKSVFLDWVSQVRAYYESVTNKVIIPGGNSPF
ncbi:hypothetical protein [Gottschalkia acidurici]|nr:hypothetical protein [Gottschalkia acidurici]